MDRLKQYVEKNLGTYSDKRPIILDTTCRDGEQTQDVSFTRDEKLNIVKNLFLLGVDRAEIASAGLRKGQREHEQGTARYVCNWAEENGMLDRIEMLGFLTADSIDWIYDTGCRTVNLLGKGDTHHVEVQLKKDDLDHMRDILHVAEYARGKDLNVNVYLEAWSDGFKAYKEKGDEYAVEVIDVLTHSGLVGNIIICDTMGIMMPSVTYLAAKFIKEHYKTRLEFHGHNDYGLAVENSVQAVLAGFDGVHVTVNGLGERAGNADMFGLAANLKDLYGIDCGLKENMFSDISALVARFSGIKPAKNKPIVGENVRVQNCGNHADGDDKGGLYSNKLTEPGRFGIQSRKTYSLGKNAGKGNIRHHLKELGIELPDDKEKELTERVQELGQKKNKISQADLLFLIDDIVENPELRPFRIDDCNVSVSMNGGRKASVQAKYRGEAYSAEAEGDGGFNALWNCVRQMFPDTELPELVDYSVSIPLGGETSALTMASIEWDYKGERIVTHGIETDQVMAAVNSLEKMMNMILRNANH